MKTFTLPQPIARLHLDLADRASGRGSCLYLLRGGDVYCLDVGQVVECGDG